MEALDNNKKRIMILTTRHECNDNRVYQKEVLSAASFGFDVLYVAPNNIDKNVENVTFYSIKKENNLFKRLRGMRSIYKLIKRINPDLVHIQDIELLPLLLKVKKRLKICGVYDVHEDYRLQMLDKFWLPRISRKAMSRYVMHIENKADKLLDGIICADNFISKYFKNPKTIVAFNYPKITDFNETIMEPDINKRTCYDIIFPGSMKVFTADIIIDIVKECHRRGYEINCCLISPFHFSGGKEHVFESIKNSGIDQKFFTILDPVDPLQVQNYLIKSKIGLIPLPDTPKLQHNIPTKMFEYMFEYMPVLGSDLAPARTYMEKCNFGFLVKYDSVDDYADKIILLLNDSNLANDLGKNGHQFIKEVVCWEKESEKIKELYLEILTNG